MLAGVKSSSLVFATNHSGNHATSTVKLRHILVSVLSRVFILQILPTALTHYLLYCAPKPLFQQQCTHTPDYGAVGSRSTSLLWHEGRGVSQTSEPQDHTVWGQHLEQDLQSQACKAGALCHHSIPLSLKYSLFPMDVCALYKFISLQ